MCMSCWLQLCARELQGPPAAAHPHPTGTLTAPPPDSSVALPSRPSTVTLPPPLSRVAAVHDMCDSRMPPPPLDTCACNHTTTQHSLQLQCRMLRLPACLPAQLTLLPYIALTVTEPLELTTSASSANRRCTLMTPPPLRTRTCAALSSPTCSAAAARQERGTQWLHQLQQRVPHTQHSTPRGQAQTQLRAQTPCACSQRCILAHAASRRTRPAAVADLDMPADCGRCLPRLRLNCRGDGRIGRAAALELSAAAASDQRQLSLLQLRQAHVAAGSSHADAAEAAQIGRAHV